MKKNQYIFALSIFLLFCSACQKPVDTTSLEEKIEDEKEQPMIEVPYTEPNFIATTERNSFQGMILGKSITYKEFMPEDRENVAIQSLPNFVEIYAWKKFFQFWASFDAKRWLHTRVSMSSGIEGSRRWLLVNIPSLTLQDESNEMSYTNPNSLKKLLGLGGKKLLDPSNNTADSVAGFSLTYVNAQEMLGTSFGKQKNNALQIVDVKQFTPLPPSKAPYGLQVKYKINCKLYKATGEYVGDIKEAELVTKYYYEPIPK